MKRAPAALATVGTPESPLGDVDDPDADEHAVFDGRRPPAEKYRRQIGAG